MYSFIICALKLTPVGIGFIFLSPPILLGSRPSISNIFKFFFGGHMTDPLTGCRIIKRKAMNEINLDALKMDSTTQMSIRGLKIGQKIEEIEGNEGERIGGERKMRPIDVGLQISYQIIKEFIFWRRKND